MNKTVMSNLNSLEAAHSLLMNENAYKTLAADKKRPLFVHEWLRYLDKNLTNTVKSELKEIQPKLLNQLFSLFNAFPGPPIRHLIAKNIATLYSIGDLLSLHTTIEKCNDLIRSKEHETQMQQMSKLCALNVIGALYEKLGRMVGTSYEETVQVLLKYMKSADSQVRIEIIQTFEKILFGLGTAGQSVHKDIYKQLKDCMLDRSQAVRCASIKCLCEMIKHSVFLYSAASASNTLSSSSTATTTSSASSSNISHELDSNVKLAFKALNIGDSSNYDVRCIVGIYLAQLIFYSISQLQLQQLQLQQQQQMANAAASSLSTSTSSSSGAGSGINTGLDGTEKQQRQQAIQQQQNAAAQLMMNEKIKNTIYLLANGFFKLNSSYSSSSRSFNYVRGAASSLAASANSVVIGNSNNLANIPANQTSSSISSTLPANQNNGNNNLTDESDMNQTNNSMQSNNTNTRVKQPIITSLPASSNGSSGSIINRETRIGATYAYVELANLLGPQWLERNLRLYLTHVLNLVNNTKAVSTHLDAVYSRKCVQFILRSIIGGMLNEKLQLEAGRELIIIIDKCNRGIDLLSSNDNNNKNQSINNNNNGINYQQQQHHVLICALYELSCILKCLNTSASVLIEDCKLIDKIQATLVSPNNAVKCAGAWCLRILACSSPSLMASLLDNCMDRLSLSMNTLPSDALIGYGYACAALIGTVHACPLGIPHIKPKLAFNIGEELLRTASQSNNITLALNKTSIGWLLLGAFMTLNSSTIVRKHLPRLKKLWHLTMPTSLEQLETEKKRGDLFTWQLSLESRQGALSSIHSFLVYCNDLLQTNNDSTTSTTNTNTTSSTHHTVDLHKNLVNSILTPIEGAILLLSQLPSIIKLNNNSVVLKAQAATFRLKLYQTLIAMPSPSLFESNFAIILRELVAEFTLADQPSSSLVTSTLRSVCHSNDSILFNNCWLQDADFKAIEDQLQPHSASGCEALEHDVTYLYQRTPSYSSSAIIGLGAGSSASSSAGSSTVSSALLSTSTTGVCNHSNTGINHLTSGINMYSSSTFLTYSFSSSSSIHAANSNSTGCLSALPLGVAVIDAAIQLYGLMYPKVPNKHRLQMLLHFSDCIQKQATSKSNAACKQALQINIFTAVLGSLKSLAETKTDLGDEASIRKATLKLVMETLCHSNPILRCAAGEALGRMTQVVGESHFVIEVAQFCFEKLRNSKDEFSKTGYALGLGCLHRYLGSMGAGQHMTSSISILFALAQNSSSAIVQVWAIHALYLIVDSGGSMFRNYIEPCVEHIFQSVLNIPHTNRDVFVGLGKLLGSLITFMGPELQIDTPSNNDMRLACLTTCTVMQIHSDSMIRAESIQCLQQLHLFASKHVSLPNLVPYLLENILSKEFLLRKVAVSCLRQLCQKDSLEVCRITVDYVQETKPMGLLSLINEQRGLECLLFKLLDIEVNPFLIRDIHDILNSLLCSSLNEKTLKRWIFLLKDIAISAEDSSNNNNQSTEDKKTSIRKVKKKQNEEEEDEEEDDTELYDDSQSFQTQSNNDPLSNVMRSPSVSSNLNNSIVNNANIIRMKQITKIIAPKWPNRVFSVELIRRIMCMCVSLSDETIKNNIIFSNQIQQPHIQLQQHQNNNNKNDTNPHFSLLLARKLKQKQQQQKKSSLSMNEDDYLILFLQDLMRIACIAATSNCDPLKLAGLDLLNDLIFYFGQVEEPNPEFKGHLILEQYQAQVSACLRAQFSFETSAHVVSKACQVCSMWISSGVARDLNDLRRVHQLLVSSLQKLTNNNNNNQSTNPIKTSTNNENLIYSELSLTVEKLAVLRAWAEVYIVAQNRRKQNGSLSSTESLLNLVQPELSLLSYHWSIALKDYAFLSLPNDYASQLPIEGGAFYHADLVESSRPVYKEHFTKILLAYSIWLNEIQFNIEEMSNNQAISDDQKEKLFFMLLGLSLEHLSNTTGLAKLNDETIEHILESIINLLNTSVAKQLLLNKKCSLCVEILSILYKVKLTRDVMNINLLVIRIVNEINQLRCVASNSNDVDKADTTTSKAKVNSAVTSLIYVQLEICIRDLIKYLPNLLVASSDQQQLNRAKTSFLHMNSTTCKALNLNDAELIKCVLNVLNDLPFQIGITVEKRISLISIVFHILFNILQSSESLLNNNLELEKFFYDSIYHSFKVMCSISSTTSKYSSYFITKTDDNDQTTTTTKLISLQQSALISTLTLKNVNPCIIMKLLSIFFQYCSMKVFEPLNVYEKCKVFMCSMRCSDNRNELLCMIQSLNEILSNKETQKELRIVLLKEHLSYLLKLTSSTVNIPPNSSSSTTTHNNSHFLTRTNENGVELIKSLLDLLESMVNLMEEESTETLTIYIHILTTYLSESDSINPNMKYACELNDLVLKKLLNLGTNHKQEFKLVLNKWPNIKVKIENAFKMSTTTTASSSSSSSLSATNPASPSVNNSSSHLANNLNQSSTPGSGSSKAPKIQLKNFANFK